MLEPSLAAPTAGARSDSSDWTPKFVAAFLATCLLSEFVAASYTLITIAIPEISRHFATTQAVWLLAGMQLVTGVSCPLLGKLADLYGKRRIVLIAVSLAALGSVISLIAPTILLLIIGQCFLGFASAAMILSFALIRDVFPPRIVPMAVSMSAAGTGILLAVLPLFAGWLLTTLGFRSIFACQLGLLVVILVSIRFAMPETPLRKPATLDILGGVLLAVGVACILVAISLGQSWGWTSAGFIGLVAAGLVVLVMYGLWSRRVSEPVLDLTMFVRRPILMITTAGVLGYASLAVATTIIPIIAQSPQVDGVGFGLGMNPTQYAALAAPLGMATCASGFLTGKLVPRIGARRCMLLSILLLFVGGTTLVFFMNTYWQLLIAVIVIGLGTGAGIASVPNLVIANAPAQDLGTVTGNVQVVQSAATSIGIVVMFAVLNAHATVTGAGVLYEKVGFQVSALMLAGIAAVGGLLLLTVFAPRRLAKAAVAQEA